MIKKDLKRLLLVVALQVVPVHEGDSHAALGLLQLQVGPKDPPLLKADVLIHG